VETTLRILGDGLTITALSIICGLSRMAFKRTPADARVPLPWGGRGSRALALWFTPTVAIVSLLGLTFFGLTRVQGFNSAIILFGVRSLLTALFCLAHLNHLRIVGQTLSSEGVIEP
jgi:hypothetical protein